MRSNVDASPSDTLLQSCDTFYALRCVYILQNCNFRTFYTILAFSDLIAAIQHVLTTNRLFTLQIDFDVRDSNVRDCFAGAS